MHGLRAFLHDHRRLAALLVALALLIKALVPGGYMIVAQGKVVTVSICADASGAKQTRQIVLPTGEKPQNEHAGKTQAACPYAGLGMAALTGGEGALLALAVAFAIALGFAPVGAAPAAPRRHLRPPLRGPPSLRTA